MSSLALEAEDSKLAEDAPVNENSDDEGSQDSQAPELGEDQCPACEQEFGTQDQENQRFHKIQQFPFSH